MTTMNTRPIADPIAPEPPTAHDSLLILPPWRVEGGPAEARHQEDGLRLVSASRRGVLTLGLAAVLGGAGALEANGALAAPGNYQANWRYCGKCGGLWWAGSAPDDGNICPYDGDAHDPGGSPNYRLRYGKRVAGYVDNWRYCRKCRALWYAGGTSLSVCPGDGAHSKGTGNYLVGRGGNDPEQRPQWQRCRSCQGLWWAGQNPGGGNCPSPRHAYRHIRGNANYRVYSK